MRLIHTPRQRTQKLARLLLLGGLLLAILIVWILNIFGIIGGAWSAIFNALCAISGLALALWHWSASERPDATNESANSPRGRTNTTPDRHDQA